MNPHPPFSRTPERIDTRSLPLSVTHRMSDAARESALLKQALRRVRRLMAGRDHAPGATPATCVVCVATSALRNGVLP